MHTHLNLASGDWLFRCGTFHLKCRLTSSEEFGWLWADLSAEDTSEFTLMLLLTVSSSSGSHPCPGQNMTTTMLQWSGGMLWILRSFFLSPYSSLILLVQVDLCLICQHDSISSKLDLVLKHTSGTLVKPSLVCWRWHRPTYLVDLANCCEGAFLGFLCYLPHWPPCSSGSFGIAGLTSAFLFTLSAGPFLDTGLSLGGFLIEFLICGTWSAHLLLRALYSLSHLSLNDCMCMWSLYVHVKRFLLCWINKVMLLVSIP